MSKDYETTFTGNVHNRKEELDRWQWYGERTDILHAIEFLLSKLPHEELSQEMKAILERIDKNRLVKND